ncbi:hypothetical protein MTR67_037968 [Solanum verrucosum]|uniref:KIB1-4 beta-propeller domain-containing protein n=1 Tax=Solanum verrucosum TaxID=315347 RepID=A0AAF0ZNZ4_SOLVR|nr:hypothetical protein MTR67_037968 [Solanum verrucosum]
MMRLEEKKKENLEYYGPPLSSQPHPWLVICPSRKTQTFFSISEDQSYIRSIPELGNALIRAYAQEWLVLEDFDSSNCYLWNAISNDKIQLPPLPYDDQLLCLLSAPPNDPECCILFLIHETTHPDNDDDENSNDDTEDENSNDDTDTNDDDTDNENLDDDDTNDDYPDDDDDDDDETDVNDDDTDNENLNDDDLDSNDDDTDNENPNDDDDTDSNDDDTDNENRDDDDLDSTDDDTDNEANDDNQDDDVNNDENAAALYLCKPGYSQEFHKQDLKSIIGDNCFSVWTVFKGDFYALTMQTRILLRLDVDDSSGTISATPMTYEPPYNYFTEYLDMPRFGNYLIQSEDDNKDKVELLYIRMLFHGREFEDVYKIIVFRFDFVNKVWEEKKSIGETAIFLGPCFEGTTCCTRGTNIKKESIYFIKGRYLCIFNLETQSISVSLPCPHISKTKPPSYWLKLMDGRVR